MITLGDKVIAMKDLNPADEPDWWPLKSYIGLEAEVVGILEDEIVVKFEDGNEVGFDISELTVSNEETVDVVSNLIN